MKKLAIFCAISAGGLVAMCLIGLMIFGVMIETGQIPEAETLHGSKLNANAKNLIKEIVPFRDGETIQYFYSTSMFSYEGDGNLITNQRVISYQTLEEEFELYEADYDEIDNVEAMLSEDWLEDTVLMIETKDEEFFMLYFDITNGLDKKAVEYVQERVEQPDL